MKWICAAALLLLTASCTFTRTAPEGGNIPRQVNASNDEENLQQTFETLITSEDPEKRFLAYLERHNNLYFTAQGYLVEFDAKLKQADDALNAGAAWEEVQALSPMNDPNYKKLLASRVLLERFREKISYIYLELLKLAAYRPDADAAPPAERAEKVRRDRIATRVLSAYNRHLQRLKREGKADSVAVQALIDNSMEVIRQFNAERRRERERSAGRLEDGMPIGLPVSATPQIFASNQELVNFARRYQKDLQEAIKAGAANITAEDQAEIDSLAVEIQVPQGDRLPQQAATAAPYRPDNGPNGNMTGNGFPAGHWAITFDDGPSNKYTPEVLKTAVERQVPLTFFWLAKNMTLFPDAVKSVYKSQMAIESYSYTHANLPKMSDEKLDYEITDAIQYTARTLDGLNTEFSTEPALHQQIKFFRLPYGAGLREPRVRGRITNKGLIHVFWNVDSLDWQDKNPDSIVDRVVKQMRVQGKGIVLFHDIHPQSAAAFAKLTKIIKEQPAAISSAPIKLVSIPAITDHLNGVK